MTKKNTLTSLYLYKLAATFHGDFDERIAGHVLHSLVKLVHELKQLVHNGLQEAPVSSEIKIKNSWVPGVFNHIASVELNKCERCLT